MPKSKNRKNHKNKVKKRNEETKRLMHKYVKDRTKYLNEQKEAEIQRRIKISEAIANQSLGEFEIKPNDTTEDIKSKILTDAWAKYENPLNDVLDISDFKD